MEVKKNIKWLSINDGLSESEPTSYEYEVGETINVNSHDVYMCVEKYTVNNEIFHIFKEGEPLYNFDW